jgi:hypothetical protein
MWRTRFGVRSYWPAACPDLRRRPRWPRCALLAANCPLQMAEGLRFRARAAEERLWQGPWRQSCSQDVMHCGMVPPRKQIALCDEDTEQPGPERDKAGPRSPYAFVGTALGTRTRIRRAGTAAPAVGTPCHGVSHRRRPPFGRLRLRVGGVANRGHCLYPPASFNAAARGSARSYRVWGREAVTGFQGLLLPRCLCSQYMSQRQEYTTADLIPNPERDRGGTVALRRMRAGRPGSVRSGRERYKPGPAGPLARCGRRQAPSI